MDPKEEGKPDTRRYRRHSETIGSLEGVTDPDTAASCVDVFATGPFDSEDSEFTQKTSAQSHPERDTASGQDVQQERTGTTTGSQTRTEETRRRI